MILIADSGSTKTSWYLSDQKINGFSTLITTSGINPLLQKEEDILTILENEFTHPLRNPDKIYYYGSGCINKEINSIIESSLSKFFSCSQISVESDLLGAARSLCQNNPGIACILGTGSNSCFYDGNKIVKHISPLGYILGDEGSGAVIGKKFIADLLKNQLPEQIKIKFFSAYKFTMHEIIEHVYKKPFPNRFLAQFTKFINDNIEETPLKELVKMSFTEFFKRNISQYSESKNMPVHFTGSIAYNFRELLTEVSNEVGFTTGKITESPIHDLVQYHLKLPV